MHVFMKLPNISAHEFPQDVPTDADNLLDVQFICQHEMINDAELYQIT